VSHDVLSSAYNVASVSLTAHPLAATVEGRRETQKKREKSE
jgi:hypothetical protein